MDTNTETVVPDKIDFDGLNKVYDDWHALFISQFKGLPVRIDKTLEGGQYYVAVSRELFDKLSPPVPAGASQRP